MVWMEFPSFNTLESHTICSKSAHQDLGQNAYSTPETMFQISPNLLQTANGKFVLTLAL